MKLIIIGASGLLGGKIIESALKKGFTIYGTYYNHPINNVNSIKLDLTDKNLIYKTIKNINPEVVINTAALTDVDACEADHELAYNINVEAAATLANASSNVGAQLIQVSTDYVFDGKKGIYSEEDETHPINYYGYSKLISEEKVKSLAKEWCIVRTSVVFGWGRQHRPNFVTWVINGLRRGMKFNVVIDQYASPTFNSNLADMVVEIIERKLTGLIHTAGLDRIQRYDMAVKIAEVFELDKKLLHPVNSNSIEWKAQRPRDSSLNINKALNILKTKPFNITESLIRMKKEELDLKWI